MKFIDPKTDFAFKKIFGSESSKKILISFLNAVMELDQERRITDLTILDPYQLPKIKELKYSILDVKCRDLKGTTFVVEMQILEVEAFHKRAVYNVCKAYSDQLKLGEQYPKLNQVIGITITDFVLFEGIERYLTKHVLKENISNQVYLDEILFYFVDLPKFTKGLPELATIQEKWVCFLKIAGSLEVIPEKLAEVEEIREAFEIANVAAMTSEELEVYTKYQMAKADQIGALRLAEKRAEERGEKRGEERGREKGMQIGLLVGGIRTALGLKFPAEAEGLMEKIEKIEDLGILEEIHREVLKAKDLELVLKIVGEKAGEKA